ncbi:hypothetical protein QWY90_03970 [Flavobacterium paronense]|uniref:Right handed beta helix domain-containing protein n=1 Tax=Flavobacterium paronense TaxID=1392775 RepID=A0ABV5GHL1_9FLAO|nr:hypothetical protein [Flavobacterium paronense]MDN3676462.1 hypothetical protein [Flavobacterium paronense]
MKNSVLLLMLFLLGFVGFSQQKVALHHGSVITIFGGGDPFTAAYNAAVNGDVIYLPGGNLPYPSFIDKSLVIIGAGHYPAATVATNRTVLNGSLTIGENADNLHLEGIEIVSTLSFNNNNKVDGVVIKRCRINIIGYGGDGTTPCLNNTIRECVINSYIDFSNAKSLLFSNNIIGGYIANGTELGISNNIFLLNTFSYDFNNIDNSSISNNIILQQYAGMTYIHIGCELSTFSNNIFAGTPSVASNTFVNNYNNIAMTGLFVNQTSNIFDYADDYHLVNPLTYLGTEGSQVGIYGGLFPYKELGIPVNPNIISKTIAPQTNASGELNFQVQVKAQNN